ncbi:MAG: zinc ribbon domain-containing protein [Pyrinomonadaceae bacterium]
MPKICPHCGTATVAEARFCRACGLALSDQISEDSPSGSGPVTPGATVAFSQTRADTGELDQDLPGTISFNKVVDRPNYNTVIDRQPYNPPPEQSPPPSPPFTGQPPPAFDPNATQVDAKSTQYLNLSSSSPTSALAPQATMNLTAAISASDSSALDRGELSGTAARATNADPAAGEGPEERQLVSSAPPIVSAPLNQTSQTAAPTRPSSRIFWWSDDGSSGKQRSAACTGEA